MPNDKIDDYYLDSDNPLHEDQDNNPVHEDRLAEWMLKNDPCFLKALLGESMAQGNDKENRNSNSTTDRAEVGCVVENESFESESAMLLLAALSFWLSAV